MSRSLAQAIINSTKEDFISSVNEPYETLERRVRPLWQKRVLLLSGIISGTETFSLR
jgi:hypothetical protein